MPPRAAPMAPRGPPFLSSSLDRYLERYWAVTFTLGSLAHDNMFMRHYVGWYCTRLKVADLEYHPYRQELREQLCTRSNTNLLPLLFVNQKLVGTLNDVRRLEETKKLKDALHFGFEWSTQVENEPRGLMRSAFGDETLFHSRYRGAPIAKPVVKLPGVHPFLKS